MENIDNSPLEQQENTTPPQSEASFLAKLKTKWPIVLGALGSIVLFAAIIYAAYSYEKREQEVQATPTATIAVKTTLTPIPTIETPSRTPTSPSQDTDNENRVTIEELIASFEGGLKLLMEDTKQRLKNG